MATSIRSASARGPTEPSLRMLSKNSSFLSTSREENTDDIYSADNHLEGHSRPGPSKDTSPSALHSFSLDDAEPFVIPGAYSSHTSRSRSSVKSSGSGREARTTGKGKDRQRRQNSPPQDEHPGFIHDSIPWPSMDPEDIEVRSRTASSSSHMPWDYHIPTYRPLKYPYRDSGSSSLSHFDALPPTPVDDYSFRGRFGGPDVVAAPVSGVETMDALVDGMNGSSDDDHYSSLMSTRSNFKSTNHHPLYHPPLPKPPPGITLGVPRKSRKQSESDSDRDRQESSSPRRRKAQDKHSRPPSSRNSSAEIGRAHV